jgi:hypothetical protein
MVTWREGASTASCAATCLCCCCTVCCCLGCSCLALLKHTGVASSHLSISLAATEQHKQRCEHDDA